MPKAARGHAFSSRSTRVRRGLQSDGEHLATAGVGGDVRVWEAASGDEIWHMNHVMKVLSLTFNPDDDRYLASASSDTTAQMWDTDNGSEVARIKHAGNMGSAAVSPVGEYLLTSGVDETAWVQQWRSEGPKDEACTRLIHNLTEEEWRQYVVNMCHGKTCPDLLETEEE
jgi:WD40 repeat protein